MSAGLSSCCIITTGLPEGSPYGKPYFNFKLSVSTGDNLGCKRHSRRISLLDVDVKLRCQIPAAVHLQTAEGL